MKMQTVLTLSVMLLLSGCAHTVAEPLPPPQKMPCFKGFFTATHPGIKQKQRRLKKILKQTQKITPSAPSMTDGFVTFAYDPEKQPILQTVPFQETVIRLEPGEKFTNISSGDPSRWSYAVAISGKDEMAQQNILVKPSLPDIYTNLVITTDKRLYNLRLVSSQTAPLTRSARFIYLDASENPAAVSALEKAALVEETPQNTSRVPLHFQYAISTEGPFSASPPWQPLRVFDDGAHTVIQFPDNITQGDLPVLFVIQQGEKICVNYRFQAPYMMLDQVFREAILVSGVGRSQEAVTIKPMRH